MNLRLFNLRTQRPQVLRGAMAAAAAAEAANDEPPATVLAELRAMGVCYSEMMDLDDAARVRVLIWVAQCYQLRDPGDASALQQGEGDAA